MDIKVTVNHIATPDALYCRYDGQLHAQKVNVTLDLEDGELTADYEGSVGAIPESVFHDRTLWFGIPPLVDEVANRLLDALAPLAQRVLDGADIEWDGNNHVGVLDDDAAAARDEIERLCAWHRNSAEAGDASAQVIEYDADDWYTGFEREAIDRTGLTVDSTDADLERMAAEETELATTLSSNYGYTLLTGAYDWLHRQREKMREEYRDQLRDLAERRNLLTAQLREIREQITGGAARCDSWGDSDRHIAAVIGTSHTAVQKMLGRQHD